MLKLFSFLFILFLSLQSYGIDLRNLEIGETRIPYNHKDIDIDIKVYNSDYQVKAILDRYSFEWVRYDNILLIPRARMKMRVNNPDANLHIVYKDVITNFQQSKKNSYSELYYSLFERKKIKIYNKEELIAEISTSFKDHKKERLLIDYSCSRNGIKIEGLDKEHMAIGCKTRRIGAIGKEKPMLEISWISPELKISGTEYIPYHAAFLNQRSINIGAKNVFTGEHRSIKISARIPKRLHRIFTAYGVGAHALHTKIIEKNETTSEEEKSEIQAEIAPALFFYFNYKISKTSSIRGFNAAFFQESIFDNAGVYLGSDFGFSLDNKLYFTTLLGMQYLYFKFDDDFDEISEPIFPQGLEFMYRHAFGIQNYIISGGVFLSTTTDIDYENIWIRWGKSYFWELNLITWGKDDFEARTWGVSVGFPFKGFL